MPNNNEPKPLKPLIKLLIELGPLLTFFTAFKFGGIMVATASFMAAMTASMAASWILTRHIAVMLWVSFFLVLILGGMTLYLQDELFVKLKPTIVYSLFVIILTIGQMTGRSFLQVVLSTGLPKMVDRGWDILTRNWILFFAFLAVLNEFVWRTQSTDTWVTVKTFVFIPLMIIFSFAQAPVVMKYMIEDIDAEPEKDES